MNAPFLDQWLINICRRAFPGRHIPEVQAFKEAYDPAYENARRIALTARGVTVLRSLRGAGEGR